MPHLRKRFIEKDIEDALKFSPIVGLIGQRQVGKTTTAEGFGEYRSFDHRLTLASAESSPQAFLESHGRLVIDECQKCPSIFSALKLHVQKNKRPGQFLLTGSIRFTARKVIQESLTGRIVNIEMLPLTVAEMNNLPIQKFETWFQKPVKQLTQIFKARKAAYPRDVFTKFMARGGLPAFWAIRDEKFSSDLMRTHLETLLQRDIALIINTTVPYASLLELLGFIAARQGQPLNLSEASRTAQISPNTLKKIISAFENMFLIRRLLALGDVRTPAFFLEDQGMASFLLAHAPLNLNARFAFSQVFANIHYGSTGNFALAHYATRGGAFVDFVFRLEGKNYGFCVSDAPSHYLMKTAHSFLQNVSNGHFVALNSQVDSFEKVSDRIVVAPLLAVI